MKGSEVLTRRHQRARACATLKLVKGQQRQLALAWCALSRGQMQYFLLRRLTGYTACQIGAQQSDRLTYSTTTVTQSAHAQWQGLKCCSIIMKFKTCQSSV